MNAILRYGVLLLLGLPLTATAVTTVAKGTDPTKRVEFLIEEYKSLKTEVFSLVADSRHVETFTGAAVAAVMAWLATHAVGSTLVWYVPVVLSALGFVRAIGLYKKLQLAGQYLRATEQAFLAVKRPNGWEHYLKSRGGFWVSGSSALYG